MKKFLFALILFSGALYSPPAKAQDYAGYLAALDTLTNVDTATYDVTVTGKKHNVSFQVNVTKISGTVGGSINLYGSVDGVNWVTAAIATAITPADASANYQFVLSNNAYKMYRLRIINANTSSASHRVYLLYRKE